MNINELAHEVHANAVAHGWWDDERTAPEIIALIHSEWSEALEEARAGRPLVWYDIYDKGDDCGGGGRCGAVVNEGVCSGRAGKCERNHKPEGGAVELIDGCIRILDAFAFFHVHFNDDKTLDDLMNDAAETVLQECKDISSLVTHLHYETSCIFAATHYRPGTQPPPAMFLIGALGIACAWVRKQGLDPLAILLEKHEYNKTRPYKHGKKF